MLVAAVASPGCAGPAGPAGGALGLDDDRVTDRLQRDLADQAVVARFSTHKIVGGTGQLFEYTGGNTLFTGIVFGKR